MTRPLRIQYPGAWYHVLNRGLRRGKIFFDASDYQMFLGLLERATGLFHIEIHAFSLLPNHYHLLLRTPLANLAEAMRSVDGLYTQKINRKYGWDGSLFRGRYKSLLIEREAYLLELVRYIHLNPLKAGLEAQPGAHPWTSHRAYLHPRWTPRWLVTRVVLEHFSQDPRVARQALDEFVRSGVPPSLERRLNRSRWPAFLGSEKFKAFLRGQAEKKAFDANEVRQLKELRPAWSLPQLIEIVSRASLELGGPPAPVFLESRRGVPNPARRALIYLARKYLFFSCRELGRQLGGLCFAAISKEFRLAEKERGAKEGCSHLVDRAEKELRFQVEV